MHLKSPSSNQITDPIISNTPLRNVQSNVKLKPLAGNASMGRLEPQSKLYLS